MVLARNGNHRAAFRVTMNHDPILASPRNVQELHRQMDIQRTTWRVQRIGWWVLLLFSLAGVIGLLGQGPLAKVTDRTGDAEVNYELVLRGEGDSIVRYDLPSRDGRAVIALPARYMEAAEISAIQPETVAAFTGPDSQFFVFAAPYARAQVSMKIRARRIGWLDFTPHVNGRPLTTRHPLVLP